MKKSIPSNLSAKSDLLMVYARAWQWRCIHKNADCQLITVLKSQKTRPKFFQDFQSSNQHGTVVKSPFLKKRAFYGNGFRSGGMFMILDCLCVCVPHTKATWVTLDEHLASASFLLETIVVQ